MLETYFSASKMLWHLRSGPCGPYLDGFAAALEQQGYGPKTAVRYLRAATHVGHVMAERDASVSDIDLAAFEEHLRTCRCSRAKGGRCNHHTIYGAKLFRRHLEEIGVCKPAVTPMRPAEPQLVVGFKAWLSKHRGAGLQRYLKRRGPGSGDDPVFADTHGRPLRYIAVKETFDRLIDKIGIRSTPARRPRLHDLRHTFAVRVLQGSPTRGNRCGAHMVALATYMGHVNIYSTYWYLEATADLVRDIAMTGEAFMTEGRRA